MHFFTDFLRIVFCGTRDSGASLRQETSRKSFLSGMGRWQIIAAGNCLRMVSYSTWEMGIHRDRKLFAMVSYSAWDDGVLLRQETVCAWFPIRHETVVYHLHRKLFA